MPESEPRTGIRELRADERGAFRGPLADLLLDAVAGGASVSFMADLDQETALRFWDGVFDRVAEGRAHLFAAERQGEVLGTVQLLTGTPPNQPHRAEIAKMLVRRDARRAGLGRALMQAAERRAARLGRWLIVLDTVPGTPGERLYRSLGYVEVGRIPDYALWPDGRLCDTVFFYKRLNGARLERSRPGRHDA